MIDARTLRTDDGREVRLTGIEIPVGPGNSGPSLLHTLAVGHDITLHGGNDLPDRYGRQPAFVFIYGAETSLQTALVRAGEAVVSGNVTDQGCSSELMTSEADARAARRGVWANPDFIKDAGNSDKILSNIGQFTLVEGLVTSVRQVGATLYLNFGKRWIQGFAVTISRRMIASFAVGGMSPTALENRRIRVRGWIERRGGPRIEAVHPGQIELVSDNTAVMAGGK